MGRILDLPPWYHNRSKRHLSRSHIHQHDPFSYVEMNSITERMLYLPPYEINHREVQLSISHISRQDPLSSQHTNSNMERTLDLPPHQPNYMELHLSSSHISRYKHLTYHHIISIKGSSTVWKSHLSAFTFVLPTQKLNYRQSSRSTTTWTQSLGGPFL